jgi:hypothetical protein
MNAKRGPGYGAQPLRMYLLFTLLTDTETAVLNPAESRACIPEIIRFAINVADCEGNFRGTLHLLNFICALFNRDVVTFSHPALQLCYPRFEHLLKGIQVVVCHAHSQASRHPQTVFAEVIENETGS